MGTQRTKDSGRKDSLGRTIKESENAGTPATGVSPDATGTTARGDFTATSPESVTTASDLVTPDERRAVATMFGKFLTHPASPQHDDRLAAVAEIPAEILARLDEHVAGSQDPRAALAQIDDETLGEIADEFTEDFMDAHGAYPEVTVAAQADGFAVLDEAYDERDLPGRGLRRHLEDDLREKILDGADFSRHFVGHGTDERDVTDALASVEEAGVESIPVLSTMTEGSAGRDDMETVLSSALEDAVADVRRTLRTVDYDDLGPTTAPQSVKERFTERVDERLQWAVGSQLLRMHVDSGLADGLIIELVAEPRSTLIRDLSDEVIRTKVRDLAVYTADTAIYRARDSH